ncbi:MAG: PAS domain S-box protein [Planctomycetota bacterium]|nr:PAS domain S-box protein [Planctomycetota bacterium]
MTANHAFYENFHVTAEETQGCFVYDLGNRQWDIPKLRTLLEEVLLQGHAFQDVEVEHDFSTIGEKVMLLNARRIRRPGNNSELILLNIEDITERRLVQLLLQVSETRFRRLFEAAHDGILILDTASRKITHVNPFLTNLLDYPAEHFLGKELWEIGFLRDKQASEAAMQQLDEQGEIRYESLPLEDRHGSTHPVEMIASLYQEDHHPVIQCNFRDISDRKQAEETLLKAGALQSAIFNSANFSSIATDEKGVIQIFNVGAERMLGYTAAEVTNTITPADISDPQELITRAKALSKEFATTITPGFEALVFKAARGIEDIYELTYIRQDGSRFPAVVSVTALRDDQNAIIGYLLIGTDNTARKQVEAERMLLDQRVRDQQFYTRSLIESNIDALMTTDPRGIITDVNKQMEALTGCTRDELIGAPFKDYFTDPERAEAGIKLVLAEGKVTDYELTARGRDGQETVVSYNATTFHDRDRKLRGVFAAARDVTERNRLELQMREQKAKLSDLHRRKDEFLAMLSHELRSPLAPIANAVQLLSLQRGSENLIQQQARGIIERQMGQLQHLVNDLLEVSRITTGRVQLRRERAAIGGIAERAVETVRPLIEQRRQELTVSLPTEPVWLHADAARLEQVVVNLLSNAAEYTGEGGHVWLSVELEGDKERGRGGDGETRRWGDKEKEFSPSALSSPRLPLSSRYPRAGYRRRHQPGTAAAHLRPVHPGGTIFGPFARRIGHRTGSGATTHGITRRKS